MKKIYIGIVLLCATSVSACSPAPNHFEKTIDDFINDADEVLIASYVGHTQEGRGDTDSEYGLFLHGDINIQLKVHEVLRGDTREDAVVSTAGSSAACGYEGTSFFEKNKYLVIFVDRLEGGSLYTSHLSGNQGFGNLEDARAYVYPQDTQPLSENPVVTPGSDQRPPHSCKSWFDGCNMCNRGAPGAPLACTKMACVVQQKPECRAYFNITQDTDVENPIAPPQSISASWGISQGALVQTGEKIRGRTPSGNVWGAFEAQVGYASLHDSSGNLLDESPMQVVGEWMHEPPHEFALVFDFVTTAQSGVVTLHNENTSGSQQDVTVQIPVVFNENLIPQVQGPTNNPGEGFVGPTTPPPYKEPEAVETEETLRDSWWQQIWAWITRVFTK